MIPEKEIANQKDIQDKKIKIIIPNYNKDKNKKKANENQQSRSLNLFAEDRIVTRSTLTKITNKSNKVKTEIRNDTKKKFWK